MKNNVNDLQTYRYCKEIQYLLGRLYFLSHKFRVVHHGQRDDLPGELREFSTEEFLLNGVKALRFVSEPIQQIGKVFSLNGFWRSPKAPYFRGRRICRETEYVLNHIHGLLRGLCGDWPIDESSLVIYGDIPLEKRRAFILRYLERAEHHLWNRNKERIPIGE